MKEGNRVVDDEGQSENAKHRQQEEKSRASDDAAEARKAPEGKEGSPSKAKLKDEGSSEDKTRQNIVDAVPKSKGAQEEAKDGSESDTQDFYDLAGLEKAKPEDKAKEGMSFAEKYKKHMPNLSDVSKYSDVEDELEAKEAKQPRLTKKEHDELLEDPDLQKITKNIKTRKWSEVVNFRSEFRKEETPPPVYPKEYEHGMELNENMKKEMNEKAAKEKQEKDMLLKAHQQIEETRVKVEAEEKRIDEEKKKQENYEELKKDNPHWADYDKYVAQADERDRLKAFYKKAKQKFEAL